MSIKMSLDVPALERLFKDDKELEIQLKHGVILNFVDRYMKSLLKDELLKCEIEKIRRQVEDAIDSRVKSEIGTVKDSWGRESISLKPEIRETIGLHARAAVADEVQKFVHDKIEQYLTTKELDKYIEKSVAYKLADLTKKEVQRRAEAAMNKI